MPAVLIGVSALPAESYPQNLIRIMPAEGLRHSLPLRLVFFLENEVQSVQKTPDSSFFRRCGRQRQAGAYRLYLQFFQYAVERRTGAQGRV